MPRTVSTGVTVQIKRVSGGAVDSLRGRDCVAPPHRNRIPTRPGGISGGAGAEYQDSIKNSRPVGAGWTSPDDVKT